MSRESVMHALPKEALPLGSVIGGKYRIVRRIGEGGMGAVYEAENELTNKRVAIKWLHPTLASSLDAVRRMLREAQASARIRHPHVVDVYDVGQEGDSVFLVMEYLEGETLRDVLAARRLSILELTGILLPAMRGVQAAHAKGIVHRDIKPDNIFLARVLDSLGPVPKVLDFGISKFEAPGADAASLTQSGIAMGTPLYMSFEQLSGAKDVDARADVYAFGVILYEALTGAPPFQADSFAALAVKVATQTPIRPSARSSDIPRQLDAIILKAMARERDERYPSVEALIADLEPFAPPEARISTPRTSGLSSRPPVHSSAPSAFAATMQSPARGQPSLASHKSPRPWIFVLGALAVVGATAFFWPRAERLATPRKAEDKPTTVLKTSANEPAKQAVPERTVLPEPAKERTVTEAQAIPEEVSASAQTAPTKPEKRRGTAGMSRPAHAHAVASQTQRTEKGRTDTTQAAKRDEVPPAKAEERGELNAESPPGLSKTPGRLESVTEKDKRFRAGQPRLDQF